MLLASAPYSLFVAYLTMPYVSSFAFSAFSCECFEDHCFLRVDYAVRCSWEGADGARTPEYNRIRAVALLVISGYAFGTPLAFYLLLRRARGAILSNHSTRFSRAIHMLHDDYAPPRYYWEART